MANETTKAKANAQLSAEEVSEKFNGGRKIIDFAGRSKIFFGISIGFLVLFLLIPIIGWLIYLIFKIMMKFELAMSFGHGVAFGIGVWLLNPIFESIIAFSKNEYIE